MMDQEIAAASLKKRTTPFEYAGMIYPITRPEAQVEVAARLQEFVCSVRSVVQGWMFRRAIHMGIRQFLGGAGVPLIAALAMFATVSACRELLTQGLGAPAALIVLAPVGTIAYFGCVALLGRALLVELVRFTHFAFRRVQPAAS